MYEFHQNKSRYFEMTNWVAEKYVIPFINIPTDAKLKICEIGCGEAGVLKAFLDKGHTGVGIELMANRALLAKENLAKEIAEGRAEIINKNVYDIDPVKDINLKFDLIVLKDVIEHIPDQEIFINKIHDILLPGGKVFFAYPPWCMPFGGHQQVCKSRFLAKLPWVHLLPSRFYIFILKIFGESEATIKELMDVKSTGIGIEKMHSIIKSNGFETFKETYWITNPIYIKKFNIRPIQSKINIPYLRNFYVTAHYIMFGQTK